MSAAAIRHDAWVTIHGERGDEWERITGWRVFPVQSFLSVGARLPGLGNKDVYFLALDVVPSEIKDKIVAHLCQKFGLTGKQDGSRDFTPQALNCWDGPIKVGKKAAGALLDGREWKEFPDGRV